VKLLKKLILLDQLNELSTAPLYFIIFAGLISGLAGSLHCTGMCGGLITAITKTKYDIAIYHVGRLLGYISLGVLLPLTGIKVLNLQSNKYLALIGAITLGLTFIYLGLKQVFNWKIDLKLHRILERINHKTYSVVFSTFSKSNSLKSFSVGAISVLLPCGLLWLVIILSLTASNALYSSIFILFFWFGTVPALSFAPILIKKVLSPLQNIIPRTVPLLLITIGLVTIGHRVYMVFFQATGGHSCH